MSNTCNNMYSTSFYNADEAYGCQKVICVQKRYMVLLTWLIILHTSQASIQIIDPFDRIIDTYTTIDATNIEESVRGYIELANPPDACTALVSPNLPLPSNTTMKKMVLINGTTECDFTTKVKNAAVAGYDVAVLHNPFVTPFEYPNITFPLSDGEVNVSVVLVLCEHGIMIRENYLYNNSKKEGNYVIKIFRKYDYNFYQFLIWQFIGFVCTSVVLILFSEIYKRCKARCCGGAGDTQEETQTEQPRVVISWPLSFQEIQNFVRTNSNRIRWKFLSNLKQRHPSIEFLEGLTKCTECFICTDSFKVGESVRKLDCGHVFHNYCIDQWLVFSSNESLGTLSNSTCPTCRHHVEFMESVEEPTDRTPLLSSSCEPYGQGSRNLHQSDSMMARSCGSINQTNGLI